MSHTFAPALMATAILGFILVAGMRPVAGEPVGLVFASDVSKTDQIGATLDAGLKIVSAAQAPNLVVVVSDRPIGFFTAHTKNALIAINMAGAAGCASRFDPIEITALKVPLES